MKRSILYLAGSLLLVAGAAPLTSFAEGYWFINLKNTCGYKDGFYDPTHPGPYPTFARSSDHSGGSTPSTNPTTNGTERLQVYQGGTLQGGYDENGKHLFSETPWNIPDNTQNGETITMDCVAGLNPTFTPNQ